MQGTQVLQDALNFLARKQRYYEKLVSRFQKLAIGIAKADIAKREENEFAPQGKRAPTEWIQCPPEPIERVHFSNGIGLDLLQAPPMMQEQLSQHLFSGAT